MWNMLHGKMINDCKSSTGTLADSENTVSNLQSNEEKKSIILRIEREKKLH
jgi:hypothetical protein